MPGDGGSIKVFVVDREGHRARARGEGRRPHGERRSRSREGLTGGERIVTYGAYGVQDSAQASQLPAPRPKTRERAGANGADARASGWSLAGAVASQRRFVYLASRC